MKLRFDIARLGRWALLAAPLLIGAALFVTVFSTYRGVTTASELLVRGQADLVHDRVRSSLAEHGMRPTGADLQNIVDELADDGLRYLGLLDPEGRAVVSAGDEIGAGTPMTARPGEAQRVGDRVRIVMRGPRHGRGGPAQPRPPGPTLVIELEPKVASGLIATARETLALGALGAGGFLVVALVLVRWLLRREASERRREHDQRLASLGRMSAVLAHEIKNPLASLKGNAQLLARALPDGERPRQKADRVVSEAVRLESLVNGLLEFARTGALRRVEVDPAALAREVAGAQGAAPRITVDADAAPARWSLDPDRMRETLSNLLDNAAQAGEGPIRLTVGSRDGDLSFEVRDRGPGVAPDDLERIFEPFTTSRTHGTGLGLAVARRFVELHGGTLIAANASAAEGGGARFTARIPR